MGTAKADDVGRAARTAVKRKLVVHYFYGRRLSRFESFRHVDRLPKLSHVPSSQRSGACMDEIRSVSFLCQWISGCHDQAKLPFSFVPHIISEVFWSAHPPTPCLLSETARSAPAGPEVSPCYYARISPSGYRPPNRTSDSHAFRSPPALLLSS